MRVVKSERSKVTNTLGPNDLVLANGELEKYFFDSVNKLIYYTGLSFCDHGLPYLIYSTILKIMLILMVLSEMWYIFSATWTIDVVSSSLNALLVQFGAFYKYVVMMSNQSVFKMLASSMESKNFDISTSHRKWILEDWYKRNEASLKLLLSLGACTLVAWHIYPLLDDLDYNLVLALKLPFVYQTPIRYALTYIGAVLILSYTAYFVMAHDLILQAYLTHILCQFAVLNDCFRNILTDCKLNLKDEVVDPKNMHLNVNFRREYVKRLGNLVDQHNLILNNTLRLRDIMSGPMLAQLAFSTTLICSIGLEVATSVNVNVTKWLRGLFYLGYNMFVQYMVCKWCEEIKIQSTAIGEALYFSGWENGIALVPGVRTSILLILARANKPVCLSAGGMYDLSLEAYTDMVKTSYSALTVLLRLR